MNILRKTLFLSLLALGAVSRVQTASAGEMFSLVLDGKPNARIQTCPHVDAYEYRAVKDLQKYVSAVTGAYLHHTTFPGIYYRRAEDTPDTVEIRLCTLKNARAQLPEKIVQSLEASRHDDAFCLVAIREDSGKVLYIAGKTSKGTLYGTYAFLEDYVGVRFFHALEGGEYIPANSVISFEEMFDFRQPWVEKRFVNDGNSNALGPLGLDDFNAFLAKRAFSSITYQFMYDDRSRTELDTGALSNCPQEGGGHGIFEQAVPPAFFETHPEYFPLKNGKREKGDHTFQRCLSNPEVKRLVIAHAVRHTRYPDTTFIVMFADSPKGWCECEQCREIGIGADGKFDHCTMVHRWIVEISSAILERNPEAKLQFWSYLDYQKIPTAGDISFDSRLINVYCPYTGVQRCYAHSQYSAPCNQATREEFEGWRKYGTRMGLFQYYCYAHTPYAPLEYMLPEDNAYFREQCGELAVWIDDATNQQRPSVHLNWQFYYVASRLFWNPSLDVEALMDEAYGLYYGKAAAAMKPYHALRRKLWETGPGHTIIYQEERFTDAFQAFPGSREQLITLLDEAEQSAKGDAILKKRISYDRQWLKQYWFGEKPEAAQENSAK